MAWDGWWELDGNEVFNVARVESYCRTLTAFKPVFRNDDLRVLLGDAEYRSPLYDDAPWTDPDDLDSYDFYGLYPLSIEGMESSTRTATVTESTGDGGVITGVRLGTRQVAVNALLVAETEAGAEYGARWLRQVLSAAVCGPTDTGGAQLCYMSSEPLVEPADDPLLVPSDGPCIEDYLRSIRQVVVTSGPTVTSRRTLRSRGAVWTVQFTLVAGSPFEYGSELEVIRGFLDPAVGDPWVGDAPADASVDLDGFLMSDESPCNPPPPQPLYDPQHPAIMLPPSTPSVPLGFFEPPANWQRRQFTLPKSMIPLWGNVVPKVSIHARDDDVRNLRLRFYADPYKIGDISDDPCAFCGDLIVSYVPQGYSLIIDGTEESVTAVTAGGITQRADSLVFASDGTPFEWPVLSCGFGYIVTVDLPRTAPVPVVDLSLFVRNA